VADDDIRRAVEREPGNPPAGGGGASPPAPIRIALQSWSDAEVERERQAAAPRYEAAQRETSARRETAEMLRHYMAALDEIHNLRKALAFEAGIWLTHLDHPMRRRKPAAQSVERMRLAAVGKVMMAYSDVDREALRSALLATGAEEALTRYAWESRA